MVLEDPERLLSMERGGCVEVLERLEVRNAVKNGCCQKSQGTSYGIFRH